jgi:hypothetical protein
LIGNYLGGSSEVCNMGELMGFFFTYHTARNEYEGVPTPYGRRYVGELQEHAEAFAAGIAREEGCRFYCDSAPWNMLVIRELAERLPQAVFVLALRHYSGVVQSLQRSYRDGFEWSGADWEERARLWDSFYAKARDAPPGRTVAISYDRLCYDPIGTIARFKGDLAEVGLDPSELDERVLAESHATRAEDQRPTIVAHSDDGGIRFRSIPSFDPGRWSGGVRYRVAPIVRETDLLLGRLYPEAYASPDNFPDE